MSENFDELGELGDKIKKIIDTAVSTKDYRQMTEDIKQTVGQTVNSAVNSAVDSGSEAIKNGLNNVFGTGNSQSGDSGVYRNKTKEFEEKRRREREQEQERQRIEKEKAKEKMLTLYERNTGGRMKGMMIAVSGGILASGMGLGTLVLSIFDTRVYLMAGNHDYIKADSFYRDFQWEKNVTFFKNEQLTCVKDEKLDVYVYGLSYEHQEIENPLYDSIHPAEGDGVHILLAHGGDAKHIPMNIKSIAASGFDYIALGHIHKPQILIRDNAAYAGALEPVDRNDLGDHGYIEGHLENGRLKTNFVPFACRSYEQILLMLREDSTQASLEDMLKADLANKGRMNIYRIVIQGTRAPELLLLPERLKSFGYVTEVLDESKPSYDLEALQKKYSGTLIGDYISYFLEKDRNAVEEKALYYGLQALLETSR